MRKFTAAIVFLSLLFAFTGCSSSVVESEPTTLITTAATNEAILPVETASIPVSLTTYPLNSDSRYTSLAKELPDHIYNTLGSQNGLGGTIYEFSGTVTDYFTTETDLALFESIVVDTGKGQVVVSNHYKAVYDATVLQLGPNYAKSLYPYDIDNFALPAVGETANFIAVYIGYSEVEEKATFVLGANSSIFDILEYEDPAASVSESTTGTATESLSLDIETIISVFEPSIAENYENYTFEYDETGITLSIWQSGVASAVSQASSGDSNVRKSWDNFVASLCNLNSTMREITDSAGRSDLVITLMLLNDLNPDNVLLLIVDGVVSYDVLTD